MFGKNLSTTLPGIGAMLIAIGNILTGIFSDTSSVDWSVNLGAIIAGIGLIFAKSHNVTGGTVMQETSKEVLKEKKAEAHDAGVKP